MQPFPDIWLKAAALLHSLAKGHPLIDGNKRLSWLSARVLLDLNGVPGRPVPVDDTEGLVVSVAAGRLTEVADIAAALRTLYQAAGG
ncbi:MAG TPA: Fic family protein [Actinocrinis sp.]|nr:Fic family protein [Actinocrinis sp.]